jgi:hypothetical protein
MSVEEAIELLQDASQGIEGQELRVKTGDGLYEITDINIDENDFMIVLIDISRQPVD